MQFVFNLSSSDEGSGAEVLLRPGDAVIVRGASQLRGHLVNHVVTLILGVSGISVFGTA